MDVHKRSAAHDLLWTACAATPGLLAARLSSMHAARGAEPAPSYNCPSSAGSSQTMANRRRCSPRVAPLTHCQHGCRLQRGGHPAGGPLQGSLGGGGLRDGVWSGSSCTCRFVERRRRRRPCRLRRCVVRPGGWRPVAAASLGHGSWCCGRAARRGIGAASEQALGPSSRRRKRELGPVG